MTKHIPGGLSNPLYYLCLRFCLLHPAHPSPLTPHPHPHPSPRHSPHLSLKCKRAVASHFDGIGGVMWRARIRTLSGHSVYLKGLSRWPPLGVTG